MPDSKYHAPKITDPDRITPQLLRDDICFDVSRSFRSGYNEDQVDDFLDILAVRIENLMRENDVLRNGVVLDIKQKWENQWSDEIDAALKARDGFTNAELLAYRTLLYKILQDLGHSRAQEVADD